MGIDSLIALKTHHTVGAGTAMTSFNILAPASSWEKVPFRVSPLHSNAKYPKK